MQVFYPFRSMKKTARSLDYRRLGKQRVECYQILACIAGKKVEAFNNGFQLVPAGRGWANHPITKLWTPHPSYLVSYATTMCDEWVARGYRDTTKDKIEYLADRMGWDEGRQNRPLFIGNTEFHDLYKAILLRKDPKFYLESFGLQRRTPELKAILSTPDNAITRWVP